MSVIKLRNGTEYRNCQLLTSEYFRALLIIVRDGCANLYVNPAEIAWALEDE